MNDEEKMWGMFCHLASFAEFVFPIAGNIIGPLIVYLLKKDEYASVVEHGKESLNFQISCTIYAAVITASGLLVCFLWLLLAPIAVMQIVLVVIACLEANKGNQYRYPLTIRFIT